MNANWPPLTKRQYLRELVYEKNKWDEPPSDADKANGFLGWHERGNSHHFPIMPAEGSSVPGRAHSFSLGGRSLKVRRFRTVASVSPSTTR